MQSRRHADMDSQKNGDSCDGEMNPCPFTYNGLNLLQKWDRAIK